MLWLRDQLQKSISAKIKNCRKLFIRVHVRRAVLSVCFHFVPQLLFSYTFLILEVLFALSTKQSWFEFVLCIIWISAVFVFFLYFSCLESKLISFFLLFTSKYTDIFNAFLPCMKKSLLSTFLIYMLMKTKHNFHESTFFKTLSNISHSILQVFSKCTKINFVYTIRLPDSLNYFEAYYFDCFFSYRSA